MLNTIFARLRFGRSHASGVVPALPSMFDNIISIRLYETEQMPHDPCDPNDELDNEPLTVDKVGCFANGTNSSYIVALYDKWSENPFSVHKSWHIYFEEVMGKTERSIIVNNAACIIEFYKRWQIDPDIVEESWREYFLNSMPVMEPETKININETINSEHYSEVPDTKLQTSIVPVVQLKEPEDSTFLAKQETIASVKDSLQLHGTVYDYFEAIARPDAKWLLKPSTLEDNLNYTRSLAIYYLKEPVKSNTNGSYKQKSLSWKCKLCTPHNFIGECPKKEQQKSEKEDSDIMKRQEDKKQQNSI